MADTVDIGVNVRSTGSEDQLAAAFTAAFRQAFDRMGPEVGRTFAKNFQKTFTQGTNLDEMFNGAIQGARGISSQLRDVGQRLDALSSSGQAWRRSFGDAFDPRVFDAFDAAIKDSILLQEELARAGADPRAIDAIRQRTQLLKSEVTAVRTAAQQATLATREANNAQARDLNQTSRERIAIINAEKARAVVAAQTAASREVAAVRSASQEQVALTQAAAKRRAATFALVATAVRSSERAIRATFQGTSRVVSSALSGITRTASSVASGVTGIFRRGNRSVVNNFNDASSNITNSYRRSWRRNTSIVNNELNQQESRVKEFAREASEEISTIGLGRVAGFAALGVVAGRALRGGFERAATLEDSERGLTALLGSAEEAVKLREEILNVVTGTPFKLDQFAQAGAQLVAFNIEAEKVPEILTAIADAAAIRGGDAGQTIDSLVRVFGQISSSGRLTGEDLNQLSEAGVPALQILGNAYGKLNGDMRDMISEGAVPANEALQILTDGITQGTDGVNGATAAFGGLAKELGTTLRGSVGNFSAALDRLGATIITKFQPLLVGLVRAGTEFVDVLASAFASLGDAIVASPLFKVALPLFESLGSKIETAGEKIKPVLDFLAEGLVAFGTAAGAVAGIRRLPVLINAVTFAFRRLLTPFNLLIGAGILVGGFISRLVRESPDLAAALSNLGNSFGRIARIVADLVSDVFNALATVLDEVITPAVGFLAEKIVAVAVPALEAFNDFIVENVIPVVRNVARFIRTEVVPVVSDVLSRAVEIGTNAFRSLADFISSTLAPVFREVGAFARAAFEIFTQGGTTLGSDGWLSYNGPVIKGLFRIREAFEDLYRFLEGTFVPFIRDNLNVAFAGVAATLGALVLTGGNLPLAGLVGVGAAIGTALTNDDVRARVIEFFDNLIDGIRERISNIFNGDTLQRVGVGVLRVAERIGRVLGDALSDRRLVAVVGGIVAAAGAVAAAFVVGFGRGIVENIPELIDLFTDVLGSALSAAFEEIASDPKIAAAVVGGILGVAAIAKFVSEGRRAGRVLGQAISEGAVTAGGQGFGAGSRGLLTGLLGGTAGIRESAARAGQSYGRTLATAIRNEIRLINKLGGNLPADPIGLGRVAGESFVQQNQRLAGSLKTLQTETKRLGSELGTAAVSGVRLREGLQQIGSGSVRQGFAQLGTAVKNSGRAIASAAGTVAGAAFMASFVSQALFDAEASAGSKIQAALGTIAIGATAGQQLGGAKGAAIGAGLGLAVTAIGLLTTRVDEQAEALKRAKEAAEEYGDAIKNLDLGGDLRDAFRTTFEANVRENEDVLATLDEIGFKYEQIESVLTRDVSGGIFIAGVKNQLREAGIEGEQFEATLEFLRTELDGFRIATTTEGAAQSIFASTTVDAEAAKGAIEVADTATKAFKDRVEELNEARIDGFKSRVDEAKGALDAAGAAADAAKEKLRQYLAGETVERGLTQQVNDTIIGVANIAAGLEGLDLNLIKDKASFDNQIAEVQSQVAGILTEGAPAAEDLANFIAPLRTAIEQEDLSPELAAALQGGIDAAVAAYVAPEGQNLLTGLFDATAIETEAETALSTARTALESALETDPLEIPLILEVAQADFETAGADALQGFADGFDGTEAKDAARQMAEDALAEARAAIGANSPSEEFAQLGRWSAEGYAEGIRGEKSRVFAASREVGLFAMQGFRAGIEAGRGQVLTAARSIANAAALVMEQALEVSSPSKVTERIGEYFGEGFAEGISASDTKVLGAAVDLANKALKGLAATGRAAAKAIGRGLAEEGPSFISSISGAMDDAFAAASSKAEQFKAIGGQIAANLFGRQGTDAFGGSNRTGGAVEAILQKAYLDILASTRSFRDTVQGNVDKAGFFKGAFIDAGTETGQENRAAFLQAGLNIRDYVETVLESGRSTKEAADAAKFQRDQLLATAKAFGIYGPTLTELINTLGLSNAQLDQWVKSVNATTTAVTAATKAEEARIKAEAAAAAAAANAPATPVQQPIFRDLLIQTPTSDPEAVALYVANRVALSARR